MQHGLRSIQGDVGITFVYVTHDQEEVLTMSDRLAVFADGRIRRAEGRRRRERREHGAERGRGRRRRSPAGVPAGRTNGGTEGEGPSCPGHRYGALSRTVETSVLAMGWIPAPERDTLRSATFTAAVRRRTESAIGG